MLGRSAGHRRTHGRGRKLGGIAAQLCPELDGVLIVPMICITDRVEHAVTDQVFATCHIGRYPALCGHLVVPGSLTEPPGRPCRACLARLRPPPTPTGAPAALRPWRRFRAGVPRMLALLGFR